MEGTPTFLTSGGRTAGFSLYIFTLPPRAALNEPGEAPPHGAIQLGVLWRPRLGYT